MRLTSNQESVAKGEVSVLAIVETLLAIALVFYLSAHFNTLRWLSIAMWVSPLLLLRTDESTRLGLDLWNHVGEVSSRVDRRLDRFETLVKSSEKEKPLVFFFGHILLFCIRAFTSFWASYRVPPWCGLRQQYRLCSDNRGQQLRPSPKTGPA